MGELAFIHVPKMMPVEVKGKCDNEKRKYNKVFQLRDFYIRVVEDHKVSDGVKRKPKTLNELAAEAESLAVSSEGAESPDASPVGKNLLYAFASHMSEADLVKFLPSDGLLSFVTAMCKSSRTTAMTVITRKVIFETNTHGGMARRGQAVNMMKFAVELCKIQRRAERAFVFEHPRSAISSEIVLELRQLMN